MTVSNELIDRLLADYKKPLLLIEGTQECLSYRPFILEKHCRQLAIFIVSTR